MGKRKRRPARSPAPRPVAGPAHQVGPGVVITLEYEVYDQDRELAGGSDGAKEVLFGFGDLLPAVERALAGMAPGDQRRIRLPPEDAFGPRDPTAQLEVDRAEFPPDVAPGDRFDAEDEQGMPVVLRVLDVLDDCVVLDQNHPLSGQTIEVAVRVLGTRPATAQELERAERALEEPRAEPGPALISADRLLRGPSRRYESDDRRDRRGARRGPQGDPQ